MTFVIKQFYTGHPLREGENWIDFYKDFGYTLKVVLEIVNQGEISDIYYNLYEDEEEKHVVVVMVPYKFYNVPVRVSDKLSLIEETDLDYMFHLMYDKLLYSKVKRRLLPARKLF